MPSYEGQLMAEAKRVARFSRRVSQLKRDLKQAQKDLRTAQKDLRKLAGMARDPFIQAPPLRAFGEESR